jgi:hypothetical protein
VIAARRLAAEARGPFFVAGKPVESKDAGKALGLRMSGCAGGAARLIIVTHPCYAQHPLLAEGIALRAELQAKFEELLVEYRAMRAREIRTNFR